MSASTLGYLLSDDSRFRLERVRGTLDLIEHLASEGDLVKAPGRHSIRWEELAALIGLVSNELRAVLADSSAAARLIEPEAGSES